VFAVGSYGTILHYGGNSGSDDDAVNDDDASDDDTTPDDDTTGDDDTTPDDDTVDDDTVGLTWVSIPAGTYWMGCEPQDTNCNANENPRHQVTLSAFQITQADITQAQYQAVTGTNPSYFQPPSYPSCPDCPVEQVTWYNADDYCAAVGGRLVTEAEWEYAARAGTSTIYICGDDPSCLDSIAWYSSNSGDTTHPVCQKAPNVWGLCDMAGDVFQWVNDWYDANYYSVSPTDDPPGPATGVYHVLRAGSWNNAYDYYLRASARDCLNPDYAVMNDGFRCARD
jgi:formylglycine-generating enzyme required for sulfatase activity